MANINKALKKTNQLIKKASKKGIESLSDDSVKALRLDRRAGEKIAEKAGYETTDRVIKRGLTDKNDDVINKAIKLDKAYDVAPNTRFPNREEQKAALLEKRQALKNKYDNEANNISKKQKLVADSGKNSKTAGGYETRNTRRKQFSDAERDLRKTTAEKKRKTENFNNKINGIFNKSTAQKAVGLGVGGYLVLNMFDQGGKMSNAELYGQQPQYGY